MMLTKKPQTQARGRLRRKLLLDAAQDLLQTHELDAISLSDVAELAGVPKGSAYHFFASIAEVYSELTKRISEEICEDQRRPITRPIASWQDVFAECVERGADFFNCNIASKQLILGPKSPPEIKRSDRQNDYEIGRCVQENIALFYALPEFPNRDAIFFRAVEIADLMFCLSVLEHDTITPEMTAEAVKAGNAYLSLYVPPYLPAAAAKGERSTESTIA